MATSLRLDALQLMCLVACSHVRAGVALRCAVFGRHITVCCGRHAGMASSQARAHTRNPPFAPHSPPALAVGACLQLGSPQFWTDKSVAYGHHGVQGNNNTFTIIYGTFSNWEKYMLPAS
jgi:hypothetical protein